MTRSFSDVLKGVTRNAHRTGKPVRRNSYNRGERENRVWRPINKREVGARLRAAEQFDRKHKQPGKRNGPLGHVGLEVLRQLYRVVDHKNGRCEPSIDYVARAIGRARASVVAALKRLKAHGFVNWLRRTEPTENDGAGPQVKQIPNAYWFSLPKFAAELVERLTSRGPIPADEQWRLDEARAAHKAMLATLPLAELPHATVMDPGLAAALSLLGAGVTRTVSSASSASGQNPAEKV